MEEEQLFSGFCRQQDQTRRVFFSYEVTEAGRELSDSCVIAQEATAHCGK